MKNFLKHTFYVLWTCGIAIATIYFLQKMTIHECLYGQSGAKMCFVEDRFEFTTPEGSGFTVTPDKNNNPILTIQ